MHTTTRATLTAVEKLLPEGLRPVNRALLLLRARHRTEHLPSTEKHPVGTLYTRALPPLRPLGLFPGLVRACWTALFLLTTVALRALHPYLVDIRLRRDRKSLLLLV